MLFQIGHRDLDNLEHRTLEKNISMTVRRKCTSMYLPRYIMHLLALEYKQRCLSMRDGNCLNKSCYYNRIRLRFVSLIEHPSHGLQVAAITDFTWDHAESQFLEVSITDRLQSQHQPCSSHTLAYTRLYLDELMIL
jgi:hypothetical protein